MVLEGGAGVSLRCDGMVVDRGAGGLEVGGEKEKGEGGLVSVLVMEIRSSEVFWRLEGFLMLTEGGLVQGSSRGRIC